MYGCEIVWPLPIGNGELSLREYLPAGLHELMTGNATHAVENPLIDDVTFGQLCRHHFVTFLDERVNASPAGRLDSLTES